jgi:hypothetical protein
MFELVHAAGAAGSNNSLQRVLRRFAAWCPGTLAADEELSALVVPLRLIYSTQRLEAANLRAVGRGGIEE